MGTLPSYRQCVAGLLTPVGGVRAAVRVDDVHPAGVGGVQANLTRLVAEVRVCRVQA